MEQIPTLAQQLKTWLENPDAPLSAETQEQLEREYPFFSVTEGMNLRKRAMELPEDERRKMIERVVLSLSDPDAARRLVDSDAGRFDNFYPDRTESKTPDTNSAITKFLENYGSGDAGEISVLEQLIFNPVADYSQQLARSEQESAPSAEPTGNDRADRINRFILSQREKESAASDTETADDALLQSDPTGKTAIPPNPEPIRIKSGSATPTPSGDSPLSESLAKIYIKTGRYERAYEILDRLSLAVPEKNAYFADQLRFLRKLIIADRLRKQKNNVE